MTSHLQRSDYLIFVQKYSARLHAVCADYFKAESLISELTLVETLGIIPSVTIEDIRQALQGSASEITQLIELIDANEELIEIMTADTYAYREQRMLLQQLSRELYTLILAIPQIQKALSNWQLQESLSNDGENADVRIASIAATRLICEILSSHSVIIEGSNR